jgi:lon-related putative ATP-dependent protease
VDKPSCELRPEQLRRRTDVSSFSFASTAELAPLQRVIGQPRALRAIDFGTDIANPGYNIFVVGLPGSGRTTVVRQFLQEQASERPVPAEWCYVYNFDDPRHPRALSLPPGRASQLGREMDEMLQQLQQEIPRAFEGEYYEGRRREISLELQRQQQELLQDLERYLKDRGFALIRSQMGLSIAPMVDGQVLSAEDYDKLDAETKKRFEAYRGELQEQYDKTMRQTRDLDRQAKEKIDGIIHELSGFVVDHLLAEIRDKFTDCSQVLTYLDAVRKDVVENPANFTPSAQQEEAGPLNMLARSSRESSLNRYKVNVIRADCTEGCAPVVMEDNPTYYNLFGRIEHRAEFGAMVTDFMQIRAGALHRANGGYLIVEAKDLLTNPLAWEGLKRALKNAEIKIEDMSQFYGMVATVTLDPEPIPLDVKLAIIGDERLYEMLYVYDEDFRELFKVKAEFSSIMPREPQSDQDYASFIGDVCRRESLRHFDPSAVARVIDEGSRMAEDQGRVTTRFAQVVDLIREAAFWSGRAGRDVVTGQDVRSAVDERVYRLSNFFERYVESIQDGIVLIDTSGEVVGQVNGLSVVSLANYEFGMPSRITVETFLGKSGVISIDREVKMSGPIHDKGQLILASYLTARFAQQRSINMSATLTFEQNYSGIEGDSASSTELYALLSRLSGAPIKQNLAVTGSVSQFGQVQAIGGVNAKIEGFFGVCKARGLTGDQGVLIPASNVRHLMLRDEVVDAVAEGKFHVYAVNKIEEGIEILTGVPAGAVDEKGDYPAGTIYGLVQQKLAQYADAMKEDGGGEEEEEEPALHGLGEADLAAEEDDSEEDEDPEPDAPAEQRRI